MYTLAALVQNGRSFLLRNNIARADTTWHSDPANGRQVAYLAGKSGAGASVDGGINSCGLALLSGVEVAGAAGDELGVLLEQTLAQCQDVESALALLAEGLSAQAGELVGRIVLADGERAAALEYGDGKVAHEMVRDGLLVRIDGSPFAVDESSPRYERMVEFAEGLYAWLPTLDGEDVVERCRAVLRQEPLCAGSTTASTVVEIEDRRVDYFLGIGSWQTQWV